MSCCENFFNLMWLLIAIATFILTVVVNYLTETGLITSHSIGEIADKYSLQIMPARWTFSIWAIIYIWQALWLLYVLKRFIFNHGKIFSAFFYISFILSNIFNIAWVFIWCDDRKLIAGIFIILITLSLYICFSISLSTLYGNNNNNNSNNNHHHHHHHHLKIKTLNVLVNNGIIFYATWSTIATCIHWGVIMKYHWSLSDNFSSFMALSILAFILLIYELLNMSFFSQYFCHIWSPFFALVIAFAGMIAKNGLTMEKPATIMVVILLGLVVISYIIKLSYCCMRRENKTNNYQLPNV